MTIENQYATPTKEIANTLEFLSQKRDSEQKIEKN